MDGASGTICHLEFAVKHPPERHWYIVSYDVSDDKRRAKVAKCLEGYGERMQFSVFRTFLSRRALARLRFELSQKMDNTDGLLIIHLCPSCQSRIQDRHGSRDWRSEVPLGFKITGDTIKHQSEKTAD
jgi:CRISPR-associated protein Cas2